MHGRWWLAAVTAGLLATTGAADGGSPNARERDIACVRLDNRMAELRLKLRSGYTAKQGRVYRQKLAALEAERRVRCR